MKEYFILTIKAGDDSFNPQAIAKVNSLAKQGWEIISTHTNKDDGHKFTFIFERLVIPKTNK